MVNEGQFEKLAQLGYELTSDPDETYNCIAYAAGITDEWWDPFGVWPDDVPKEDTVDALVQVYGRHGFKVCPDGRHENDFDKVAIYAIEGSFQHAAKLLDDGRWSSKLGPDDDIAHPELAALEGAAYGHVAMYMKRPKQ